MAIERQKMGAPEEYRGYLISLVYLGPDFLSYVDDREMPNFYMTPAAAVNGAQTFINREIKERGEKRDRAR